MQLDILNIEGKKTGRTVDLPDEIFAAAPNNHVIWLAVKQFRGAQRQGTHKVKTRAEVKGSSRKLHKQKGTGGSRKGNLRNPLYKGGGTVFGPKPHKYIIKINRKVKDLAKIGALSLKATESKIWIIEDACLEMEAPNTKNFTGILNKLDTKGRSMLFVMPEYNENVCKSIRNVPSVSGTILSDINTYDILNSDTLVFTESAAKIFADEEVDNNEEEVDNNEPAVDNNEPAVDNNESAVDNNEPAVDNNEPAEA